MSILKNAIDSIVIGLEDYESPDARRIISATRNIFAGILLLFKHKLCELSPEGSDEALIKQKILPEFGANGSINWIGVGKKTVDVQNIQDRFESLGIEVDWKRLEKINKYRNDIEHYYSSLTSESVQQLISDSFIIIRDFISEHLNQDPVELLGEDAWNTLVEVNEVYEKEKSDCVERLNTLTYYAEEIREAFIEHNCNKCGSELISPLSTEEDASDVNFQCRSCHEEFTYEELVNLAVPAYFKDAIYTSHKDGGNTPLIACPSCIEDVYIYSEAVCAACGYSAEHSCQRCSARIPPEEISEDSVCGWCAHMMAKED